MRGLYIYRSVNGWFPNQIVVLNPAPFQRPTGMILIPRPLPPLERWWNGMGEMLCHRHLCGDFMKERAQYLLLRQNIYSSSRKVLNIYPVVDWLEMLEFQIVSTLYNYSQERQVKKIHHPWLLKNSYPNITCFHKSPVRPRVFVTLADSVHHLKNNGKTSVAETNCPNTCIHQGLLNDTKPNNALL